MCPKCFVTKMAMTFVTAERGGGGSVDGECLDFVLEENAFANEKNFFRQ